MRTMMGTVGEVFTNHAHGMPEDLDGILSVVGMRQYPRGEKMASTMYRPHVIWRGAKPSITFL